MKARILAIAGVAGLGVLAQANADEIQFVTLPENDGSPRDQHSGLLSGHSGNSRQSGDL
jgi:hypothetical protein